MLQAGARAAEALELLAGITSKPNHEFWPDELPYGCAAARGVIETRGIAQGQLASDLTFFRAYLGQTPRH
ncbi:MAG: hypothetical protein LBR27_05325 [Bifidobacteriaceae bacterium]|jgi:hypothetical protein|nr:hypothetical protein [Bifidobacteriaceae bacterium]